MLSDQQESLISLTKQSGFTSFPVKRVKGSDRYTIASLPLLVIRLGLEPKTPTLKVLCSTY